MGIYLNPGNHSFNQAFHNKIYVDKSLLIEYTNQLIGTGDNKICISRPRRFGKSTDANMLVAYYSKGSDSKNIFHQLNISQCSSYLQHLNQHHVIHINMQNFTSVTSNIEEMIELFNSEIMEELEENFHIKSSQHILTFLLSKIFAKTNEGFVFIIDEWDCVFRDFPNDKEMQEKYLDFLRNLLKDKPYVDLAYMTGILPIKKYGTHSALNMFDEISMTNPFPLQKFMGFTNSEVNDLCQKFNVDQSQMTRWYDGYHYDDISLYSPKSVVSAITRNLFSNYWNDTETYEALKIYIDKNFDGLKEAIIEMISGISVPIDITAFQNDMTTFASKDDVMTLLIHLGYLGYDYQNKHVYIPNKEVRTSFITSIKNSHWQSIQGLIDSEQLLQATWNKDENKVADFISKAHLNTSILEYNSEAALKYTVLLAYYTARDYYQTILEMPSGKGYVDIAYLPKSDKPAMIIELKWNQSVHTALQQIKEKEYIHGLENYHGEILLIAIHYDQDTKKHECLIESVIQE